MNAVIVREQYPRHFFQHRACHIKPFCLTARLSADSVFTIKNRVSLVCDAQLRLGSDGAGPGTALLFVALASEGRFQLRFLAGGHKECVLLGILDDFLSHDFPFESAQSALDRFTGVDINYCHLYLQLKISHKRFQFLFNTRGRDVVKRAKNDPAKKGGLYSQG
jgi:hypothetical protein